jgi:hypothetical protein
MQRMYSCVTEAQYDVINHMIYKKRKENMKKEERKYKKKKRK